MKRLVLLVLVLFVVLGVSTIYAQGMGRAFAVKIAASDGAIKLDGVLDKENEPWKFAIPVYIVVDTATGGILTPIWQQFGTHTNDFQPAAEKHRGITDSSAIAYILWDATNLYVATAQYDDAILGGWSANPWNSDGYELYVGSKVNWTVEPLRVELTVWNGKVPPAPIVAQPDVMKSAVTIDFDQGRYWTESIIQLKKFGLDGTKITDGTSVSFDLEIDDADIPANPHQHKLAWASGGNGMWNTPALAGMLTFLGFPPADYR
jgi:hypothetical protein